MTKFKITKEQVKGFVKSCCLLAYGAAAIACACMVKGTQTNKTYYVGAAGYSDAVKVIMESSMFDSTKTRIIKLLKRNGDAGYYDAVISTVNSNMFESSKVKTIETLSKN